MVMSSQILATLEKFSRSIFNNSLGRCEMHNLKLTSRSCYKTRYMFDLLQLEHPFTLTEIKEAVFELGGDKAPRPDGFPIQFFKQFLDTIKLDSWKLCENYYFGRANLERINWQVLLSFLRLRHPNRRDDYIPISLINSSLKILSKFLATRLSKVMNSLIEANQSAFFKKEDASYTILPLLKN